MKDHGFDSAPDLQDAMSKALEKNAPRRIVEIDVQKYQAYLDNPNIDDDQKEEIVRAVWSIMVSFMELGLGVHPVQQACGQLEKDLDPEATVDSDKGTGDGIGLKTEFNDPPQSG